MSAVCQVLCLLQVAALLKVWLEELCEPLVRTDLYEQVLRTQYHHLELQRLTALRAVLTQVCQLFVQSNCAVWQAITGHTRPQAMHHSFEGISKQLKCGMICRMTHIV